jgi:hypothetical protein
MRGAAFSDPVLSGAYLLDKGMKTDSVGLICVGAFLALAGIMLLIRWLNLTRKNRLK